ncbi:cation:proton antiporter [candidate division WOR-3 bacterium RBG_13_43_14]|uniref:Cation:proton antiporter n=1 Tax=candidate division WOR-3 bacterium RBG_13_43_14 TaxID=1802590 RepID=A0A1F4U2L3_UNCW3|nr:MAG: cation:proton antiporter [candidate division WOR-3 bacterium RBG_13_43_14]
MIIFISCIILFLIGLYSIVTKRNLIKIAIGFALMEYAINLLFALIGFRKGALAPIITSVDSPHNFVDPIPQALVLTAIVIALGTTALMLVVIMRIYEKYKTFDIAEIKKLKG